ncbi:hypothetical protein BKA61DRAFT_595952 [Leptodontidium sp. MPI-SDFR-AT-0119]|nr:hypothetical protein BKA61DRAFT_595952 [Leptodontidium sp. MPI-SDFR-AT-0119]
MLPFYFAIHLAISIGFSSRPTTAQDNSISLEQAIEIPKDALIVRPSNRSQVSVAALNVVDVLSPRAWECPSAYVECYGLGTCCPGYSMSVRCCLDGTCTDPGDECCPTGGMCPFGEKCCGIDGCAPTGSVCCGNYHYCEAGNYCVWVGSVQQCCETYNCRGFGGGSDDEDEESSTTEIAAPSSSTTSASGTSTAGAGQSVVYEYYYTYVTWYYYITSYTIYVSPLLSTDTTTETFTTSTRVSLQAANSDDASLQFESLTNTMSFATPAKANLPVTVSVIQNSQATKSTTSRSIALGSSAPISSSVSNSASLNLSTETLFLGLSIRGVGVLASSLAAFLAWV